MERKASTRKLSSDFQRKLSAISNCSDVSNISLLLGMDPNDFKSTIQNILDLDTGEGWPESEDESEIGNDEDLPKPMLESVQAGRKLSVTVTPDQRKSSTSSTVSVDSLDEAESFKPVEIDIESLKSVIQQYESTQKKISMSKLAKTKNKQFNA